MDVPTAPSIGSKKLGQPVPLSNFGPDLNSGCRTPTHVNVPAPLLVQQRARAGALGAVLAQHAVLLGRQHAGATLRRSSRFRTFHSDSSFFLRRLLGDFEHVGRRQDDGAGARALPDRSSPPNALAPSVGDLPERQHADQLCRSAGRRASRRRRFPGEHEERPRLHDDRRRCRATRPPAPIRRPGRGGRTRRPRRASPAARHPPD